MIDPLLIYLLVVMAVYRTAHMIVAEDGPFDAFTKLRTFVFMRTADGHWLQRGLSCVLCVSFWLSWLFVLLLPWAGWRAYVLTSLGAAGAALIIHKVIYENG